MSKREPRTPKFRPETLPTRLEVSLTMAEKVKLGKNIKDARQRSAAGYRQDEVADILECSKTHVSDIETGKSTATIDEIAVFCNLYEITANEILDGILPIAKADEGQSGNFVLSKIRIIPDDTLKLAGRIFSYVNKLIDSELVRRGDDNKK